MRNKRSYDSHKTLEIDSIVVTSPLIKDLLQDMLDGDPGVATPHARLTFAAPFRLFVHMWERFSAAVKGMEKYDKQRLKHSILLFRVLIDELRDVISCLEDYTKNKVIAYEHI